MYPRAHLGSPQRMGKAPYSCGHLGFVCVEISPVSQEYVTVTGPEWPSEPWTLHPLLAIY